MSQAATELATSQSESTIFEVQAKDPKVIGPMGLRAAAFIIDCVTMAMILWPTIIIISLMGVNFYSLPSYYQMAANLSVNLLINMIPVAIWGGSPGKLILDLRIVNQQTGQTPSFFMIFFRETIGKWLSTIVIGLGFIWAFFSKNSEAWHDLLARTHVVSVAKLENK